MRDLARRHARSTRASIYHRRVVAHLRSVDLCRTQSPSSTGATRWSISLYLKSLNRFLMGYQVRWEEGYFPDGLVERGPSAGWHLIVVDPAA